MAFAVAVSKSAWGDRSEGTRYETRTRGSRAGSALPPVRVLRRPLSCSGLHHSRFRSRDHIRDSGTCARPSWSHRRRDNSAPRMSSSDAGRGGLGRPGRRPPPAISRLRAAARAAAVQALVAGAVANHDRAAVGAGGRILLALKGDPWLGRLNRAHRNRRLCRADCGR